MAAETIRSMALAAREAGLEAQHYQAMLVVRGAPVGHDVSMKDLAAQLFDVIEAKRGR